MSDDPELTERCRKIAEKALPCTCVIEAEVMQVNPPDIFAGIHFAGCWTAKVPHLAGFFEHELRAERVKVRRETLAEAAEICDAKAVYANRSRHGKDSFMQALLSELENVLRDTGINIRALAETGDHP